MMATHQPQKELFSYQVDLDQRVRSAHPLRRIKETIDFSFVRTEVARHYGYDGHEKTHGTDQPADMTIPWVAWGPNIKQNHEIETPIRIDDTAATAAFILKLKIPKNWDGQIITEIFR